jgi:hypothetical protein
MKRNATRNSTIVAGSAVNCMIATTPRLPAITIARLTRANE